jgi:hypothetical protein
MRRHRLRAPLTGWLKGGLGAAAVAVVFLLAVAAAPAVGASPQPRDTSTGPTTTFDLSQCGGAIPPPNCGQKPKSPTDPGGWAQFLLLGIVMGGMAGIGIVIARSTAKNTKARNAAAREAAHDVRRSSA